MRSKTCGSTTRLRVVGHVEINVFAGLRTWDIQNIRGPGNLHHRHAVHAKFQISHFNLTEEIYNLPQPNFCLTALIIYYFAL